MQIHKTLSLLCAAAVSVTVASAQSDNDAQSKAREALQKKLDELQRNPPPDAAPAQAPAPAPKAAPKPKRATKPAPVTKAPAKVETEAPHWTPTAPVPQERIAAPTPAPKTEPAPVVRTEKRMQPPQMKPAPPARVATQPEPANAAPSGNFSPEEPNATGQTENPAVRRELEKRQAEFAARRTSENPAAMSHNRPPRHPQMQAQAPSYPALDAPPLPISDSKHQQLQELLRRYQADELTPSQYHRERAKILAQP